MLEARARVELAYGGFAIHCLSTWLSRRIRAGIENRTRSIYLGKIAPVPTGYLQDDEPTPVERSRCSRSASTNHDHLRGGRLPFRCKPDVAMGIENVQFSERTAGIEPAQYGLEGRPTAMIMFANTSPCTQRRGATCENRTRRSSVPRRNLPRKGGNSGRRVNRTLISRVQTERSPVELHAHYKLRAGKMRRASVGVEADEYGPKSGFPSMVTHIQRPALHWC